jgi:predicted RNase H-like nuclease (RuvC/YqgF family)
LSEHSLNEYNIAFTTLLRDQLNTQLHLLQKQEQLTKSINKHKEHYNETISQLTTQLTQKDIDLEHVNKQLRLLKKIDQRIDQRT